MPPNPRENAHLPPESPTLSLSGNNKPIAVKSLLSQEVFNKSLTIGAG
jgi:hypothetical protein